MKPITTEEIVTEVSREIGMRKRVFARKVGEGTMRQDQMDRRIAIMERIRDDYQEKLDQQGDLFK